MLSDIDISGFFLNTPKNTGFLEKNSHNRCLRIQQIHINHPVYAVSHQLIWEISLNNIHIGSLSY